MLGLAPFHQQWEMNQGLFVAIPDPENVTSHLGMGPHLYLNEIIQKLSGRNHSNSLYYHGSI